MHAADEAEKFAPMVPGGNLKEDVEATPWTPDFATVVVKGGGLWPQLHCAADDGKIWDAPLRLFHASGRRVQ